MCRLILFVSLFVHAASWQATVSSSGTSSETNQEQEQVRKSIMRSVKQHKPENGVATSTNHDATLEASMKNQMRSSAADLFKGVQWLNTHGNRIQMANRKSAMTTAAAPKCVMVDLPNIMAVPLPSQYSGAMNNVAANMQRCVNRSTTAAYCEADDRCSWIDLPSKTNDVFPNCIVRDVEGIEFNLTGCGALKGLIDCEGDSVCEYKPADADGNTCNSTFCHVQEEKDCQNRTDKWCEPRDNGNRTAVQQIEDAQYKAKTGGKTKEQCQRDAVSACYVNKTEEHCHNYNGQDHCQNYTREEMDWDCVLKASPQGCTADLLFECFNAPAGSNGHNETTCNSFSHCAWVMESRCDQECTSEEKSYKDPHTNETRTWQEMNCKQVLKKEGACMPTFDAIVPVVARDNDAGKWVWDAWACSWSCQPFTTMAACPTSHCEWDPAEPQYKCRAKAASSGTLAQTAAKADLLQADPNCPGAGCVFDGPVMKPMPDGSLATPSNGGVDTGNQPQGDSSTPQPTTTLKDSYAPSLSASHWSMVALVMTSLAQMQ